MRLTLSKALALALIANLLPACDRTATESEGAAKRGDTSGETPAGAATGTTAERSGTEPAPRSTDPYQ